MNSANAFSYAISGAMGESQIQAYANFVNVAHQNLQGVGGWLQQQAAKTMDSFNNFVNSRSWELSARLLKKQDGTYVGRYEIGYLGSLEGLNQATGFMRDYIMANPLVMEQYLAGDLAGYGGEFNSRCSGVGADNIYYRKAMNGVLNLDTSTEDPTLRHTHYFEQGNGLSFRERVNIHKTWNAIDHHMASTEFDITSPTGDKRKSFLKDVDESE